ncbi:MAG: DUF3471 domain-containing protein [Bacteroidota bacterium]
MADHQLYSQLGRGPRSPVKAYQKDKFFFGDNAMLTLEFTGNNNDEVENLIVKYRNGNEVRNKTNKPIPSQEGVKLHEKTLERYVGKYEMTPEFTFSVTKVLDRLFIQAAGQEKLEVFAESETKFFLKVNERSWWRSWMPNAIESGPGCTLIFIILTVDFQSGPRYAKGRFQTESAFISW